MPQARTWPGAVSARLWLLPPATAVTAVPDGRLTWRGLVLFFRGPCPSWPDLLRPQASTWPVEVNARPWPPPAAMAVTTGPEGRLTWTGGAMHWQPGVVVGAVRSAPSTL